MGLWARRTQIRTARRKPPIGNGKRCYLAFCCFWYFSFYLAGIRVIGVPDGNIGLLSFGNPIGSVCIDPLKTLPTGWN